MNYLMGCGPSPRTSGYDADVERITKADHACAIAAAAAYDFNDELTVILSSVYNSISALEPGHPARPHLLDLQDAAQRCARTTSGLLSFGLSGSPRAVRGPLEKLLLVD
jgi:hypothetical protein